MSLNNDATRCRGDTMPQFGEESRTCPVREQCRRYTDKPSPRAVWSSWIHAPRISNRGCELIIRAAAESDQTPA